MRYIKYLLTIVVLCGFTFNAFCQQGNCIILKLKNGYSAKGTVIESVEGGYIKIRTLNNQEITYQFSEILSRNPCNFKENGDININIGPMLGFGSKQKSIGIGVKANYDFMENIVLAPGLTYFFSSTKTDSTGSFEKESPSQICLDLDGNYYFMKEGDLSIYGLVGLNIAYASQLTTQTYFDVEYEYYSDKKFLIGINLGGGVQYPFTDKMSGFAELKYTAASTDQLGFAAGLLFSL
jgi:opacity protein-like surface antigen